MSSAGLAMFALALLGIVVTGLPVYAVLLRWPPCSRCSA